MVANSSHRALLRVVSTVVLALTAMTLGIPAAHASSRPAPAADSAPRARQMISVLLADGQLFFRTGMRAAIAGQADLSCVAEVGDGPAAVREIQRLRPDVALVDLDLPGLAATPFEAGVTRVLALGAEHTDENLYRALRLGATGFFARPRPVNDLLAAVRAAVHGTALIDPVLTRQLVTRLSAGGEPFPAPPQAETLTPREHDVLGLLAQGYTNPEIGRALGIGAQTVKTHVSHVLTKLGVRDRVHAAVYAHRRHIG
ncbi:LuxR C-terminal-related transcriptional regulator [Nocardia sp. NPDC127579]|uniref:LuxR C-terminal-related transcriptional regulator n=1 Tax=Nocardia sp. NPDC127579 TaxID=3345402 RepID=UPI003640D1B3